MASGEKSRSGASIGSSDAAIFPLLKPNEILYRGQELFRLLEWRTETATGQLNVFRPDHLLDDLFVERWRRGLIELPAHHKGWHLQMVQQRHQISLLQDFA